MEAVYACHLTWEQFQEEVAKGTAINTFTGHLLFSRDRALAEKEMWPAYRTEFLAASLANIPIPEAVIRSNNEVIIPMINGGGKTPPLLKPLAPQVAPICSEPRNAKGRSFSWSHSAIAEFDGPLGCPRKYAESRFYCRTKFEESEAMRWGNIVHKAAEDFVKFNTIKNPEAFKPVEKYARLFRGMKLQGVDVQPELEIVLDKDLKPLTDKKAWFSDDAYFRCKIDVPFIQSPKVAIYDYKTGQNVKEDFAQLHLNMAALAIVRPDLEEFTGKLIWTKHQETTGCPPLDRDGAAQVWDETMVRVRRAEDAWATENFPARKNGLCRQYCEVFTCPHNGRS